MKAILVSDLKLSIQRILKLDVNPYKDREVRFIARKHSLFQKMNRVLLKFEVTYNSNKILQIYIRKMQTINFSSILAALIIMKV